MNSITVKMVEINGKEYANLGSGDAAKKIGKMLRVSAGGSLYKHNDEYVYTTWGVWGDKQAWYQKVIDNAAALI